MRFDDAHLETLVRFVRSHGGPPRRFLVYRRRQLEMALTLAGVDIAGKTVVEVGGGVSGHAFLVSRVSERVISSDLLNVESAFGGDFANAAAIAAIAEGRLRFVCARAEALPLDDACADIVLSSYVFEHVADRKAAAREIHRILRPGGRAIVIVPNVLETALRALWFPAVYWPRQIVKLLVMRSGVSRLVGLRFARPPDLRFHPHGSYPDLRSELRESKIDVWDSIFRGAGLVIERRYSISYEAYVGLLGDRVTTFLQGAIRPITERIGATSVGAWIGPSYGFVARRPDG